MEGSITSYNDSFGTLGTSETLGVSTTNATGQITLNDSITNYRFIQIRIGYYNSGFANYGSLLIPVSEITIASDSVYAYKVLYYVSSTLYEATVYFPTANTAYISKSNTAVCLRIVGIK